MGISPLIRTLTANPSYIRSVYKVIPEMTRSTLINQVHIRLPQGRLNAQVCPEYPRISRIPKDVWNIKVNYTKNRNQT